jgi:hypothetical protein
MLRRNVVPLTRESNRPRVLRAGTLGRFLFPLLFLALITGCAPRRARAQFIGYTAPQTNQQTLANTVACTGSAQNFNVNNFGQIFHSAQLTAVGAATQRISAVIQGSADGVNFTNISDTINQPNIPAFGIGVSTNGYFSVVRVQVNCLPVNASSTFSLSYSGVAGASNAPTGAFAQAAMNKQLLTAAPAATTTQAANVNTPFGNSSGELVLDYLGAAGPAGSTLNVTCQSLDNITTLSLTFSLATTQNLVQIFPIPPSPCTTYLITYTSGGASAATYNLDYLFSTPGTTPAVVDPCEFSGALKSSVPINITTATTTQLVPLVAGKAVYVCGASFTIAPSGTTADTILFEFGTGASCGTGTTALTGAFGAGDLTTTTGVVPVTLADPGVSMTAPAGNALCAVSAGTTVNIQGVLQFVQQ